MTETCHTADSLAEQFPDLGAFVAEDVVGSHAQEGVFSDPTAFVPELGLPVDLAASVAVCLAAVPEQAEEATTDATSLAEFVPDPQPEPELAGMAVPPPLPSSQTADDDIPAIFSRPPVRSFVVAPNAPAKPSPRSLRKFLLGAYVVVHCGVVVGLVSLAHNAQRARAPIAAMIEDVKELHAEHTLERTESKESAAKLIATRVGLNEQNAKLAHTVETDRAIELHQKKSDHQLAAFSQHEARAAAGETFTLDEAEAFLDGEQVRLPDKADTQAHAPAKAAPRVEHGPTSHVPASPN